MQVIFFKSIDKYTDYTVTFKILLTSNSSKRHKLLHFLVTFSFYVVLSCVNVSNCKILVSWETPMQMLNEKGW